MKSAKNEAGQNSEYLRDHGWKEIGQTPWKWADPLFRWCRYTERDAVEVQQGRDREVKK